MKKRTIQHHMDALAALLLFGVFAVCVLSVLLTGARAYRRLTQRDQTAYERRICTQYIATRVRQADSAGRVTVEDFDGVPALTLVDDAGYVTRVYCYDGYLMELYTAADAGLTPEAGERLLEAGNLALSLEDGLLEVIVTSPEGIEDTLYLSLRSGEGAAA